MARSKRVTLLCVRVVIPSYDESAFICNFKRLSNHQVDIIVTFFFLSLVMLIVLSALCTCMRARTHLRAYKLMRYECVEWKINVS